MADEKKKKIREILGNSGDVEKELEDGSLISLLEDRIPSGGGIYAVYPHRRHVPGKVRVFVDFLTQWFKKKST